jgi:hypothetical protein
MVLPSPLFPFAHLEAGGAFLPMGNYKNGANRHGFSLLLILLDKLVYLHCPPAISLIAFCNRFEITKLFGRQISELWVIATTAPYGCKLQR